MKIIKENRATGNDLNYECLYHRIGLAVASSTEKITIDNEKEIIETVFDAVQEWLKDVLNVQVSDARDDDSSSKA